ncbi:MAG: hypothetical protein ACM3ZV_03685 [Bacillota bacterium]
MAKLALALSLLVAASSADAQQGTSPAAPSLGDALVKAKPGGACKPDDPAEVVVCGRSQQPYRIDPGVLAATRAAEAPPPKPPLDASADQACVGPNCGGGTIPLVGMALKAIEAVELAARGDDWREAFRTRPDQYRAYEEAKAKAQQKKGGITVGITAGNK